jgi:diguanylate cyclase (GGDEF)-like protein/PAS domain S-box-containing protein
MSHPTAGNLPLPNHNFCALPPGVAKDEPEWSDLVSDLELRHIRQYGEARLGLASSLLLALAAKFRPAAMHSVRVAVGAGSWARFYGLDPDQAQALEIAGAMHDLGKIGVCDSILQKHGRLTPEEYAIVDYHRHNVISILKPSLASREIVEAIYFGIAYFDGSKSEFVRKGHQLPLAARMLAIADAFDSMTAESCYRQFRTKEEALAELFSQSNRQFDGELVSSFAKFIETNNVWTSSDSVGEWLQNLQELNNDTSWCNTFGLKTAGQKAFDREYDKTLLGMLEVGVGFLDTNCIISLWNQAAEEITGIPATEIFNRRWGWDQFEPHDEYDTLVDTGSCPVARCLTQQKPFSFKGSIERPNGSRCAVNIQVSPVYSKARVLLGAAVVIQDISSEKSLKQRVQELAVAAKTDPLTSVANRAEFDRVFQQILSEHATQRSPLSMIFTDIDYFKRINDDYGHDAGDDALKGFAAHLSRNARLGDLVSRLGGEEFAILCPETDVNKATERAEQIRSSLQALPFQSLKNRCLTASFGVAELQVGDTVESLLRRADRALLKAKQEGRNRVVSLSGFQDIETGCESNVHQQHSVLSWLFGRGHESHVQLKKELVTTVPREIVIEKIKGYVSDFDARIETASPESVSFDVDSSKLEINRRSNDRGGVFRVTLHIGDPKDVQPGAGTSILVGIVPLGKRNRRQAEIVEGMDCVYRSLRSYVVAREKGEPQFGLLEPAANRPGEGRS